MVAAWRDYVCVYGLKTKDDAGARTIEFVNYIKRQSCVPLTNLKVVRTDGGGEFQTPDFRSLVAEQGLLHQHTVPYRSSQNGVAERTIRTVTEMACAMLIDSKLPHYLWEDALRHAAYIRNRVPKKGATKTPHERLTGIKPGLRHMPVFGQSVVIRMPEPIRKKRFRFDGRGDLGGFVGFSESVKGYRVYVPGNAQRIRESAGVLALDRMLYDEVVLPDDDVAPPPEGGGVDEEGLEDRAVEAGLELPAAPTATTSRNPHQMEAVRDAVRSTHWTREAVVETNGDARLTENRSSERLSARKIGKLLETRTSKRLAAKAINAAYICFTEVIREPINLADARKTPQWPEWEKATWTEVRALEANDTYELVHLPVGAHALDNTVQLRLKLAADGSIEKYKARVCARGDCQVYLIDYVETHAPVVGLVCVKIFLAFVAKFKMRMRQGDVPAAYLKATLKETVYVKQVKGFEKPGEEDKVGRLKKALYGLKQAGREWNQEIDNFLRAYGLKPTTGDACLYHMQVEGSLLLVCLYVDDILIAHRDEEHVLHLMLALNVKYQVKDLGAPSIFLGMRIRHEQGTIRLSQETYINEMLYRFAMDPTRPTYTPMIPKTRLDNLTDEPTLEEKEKMRNKPYRQVVGSLLYLARVSRPDLVFAVNQLARHCSKPRKSAWDAAKYLMRYLGQTRNMELVLNTTEEGLRVATDADWANDVQDRKSVSGFAAFLFGCPVHWGSTKQTVVALSSTTAEFIAANDGLQQAEWIQLVVSEILAGQRSPFRLTLQVDNQPAIHRIKKEGNSGAQKAVDIRFHALKDAWRTGVMALEYVLTHENPADLMTKALSRPELHHKRGLCGLGSVLGDDPGAAACGGGVGLGV
ncbi:Retrovirus-related Pol polyprotein from transposon TNT 1-94 [Phytophthora rubi]|nr:Retrovirus-related Pol polyprotein from transposon TNT 1-94 [Phytophthora rubi]